MDWIACTEICFDHNNSVIKMLRYICYRREQQQQGLRGEVQSYERQDSLPGQERIGLPSQGTLKLITKTY